MFNFSFEQNFRFKKMLTGKNYEKLLITFNEVLRKKIQKKFIHN